VQPETVEPSPGEILARTMQGESLDEVLKDEQTPIKVETPTPQDEAPTGEEAEKPEDPKEPEKVIDYDQLIPMQGGEPVKLGELKDMAKRGRDYDVLETKLNNDLREERVYTGALKRDLEQVASYMQSKGMLDAEMLQVVNAVYAQQVAQNTKITETLIPSWKDAQQVQSDVVILQEWGKQYGISPAIMEQIPNGDPNFAYALHDVATMWHKVRGRLDAKNPKHRKPSNRKPVKTLNSEKLLKQAEQSQNVDDKKAAMGAILRGE